MFTGEREREGEIEREDSKKRKHSLGHKEGWRIHRGNKVRTEWSEDSEHTE